MSLSAEDWIRSGRTEQKSDSGNTLDLMPGPKNPDDMAQYGKKKKKEHLKAKINPKRQENTKAGFCLREAANTGTFKLGFNGVVVPPPSR